MIIGLSVFGLVFCCVLCCILCGVCRARRLANSSAAHIAAHHGNDHHDSFKAVHDGVPADQAGYYPAQQVMQGQPLAANYGQNPSGYAMPNNGGMGMQMPINNGGMGMQMPMNTGGMGMHMPMMQEHPAPYVYNPDQPPAAAG